MNRRIIIFTLIFLMLGTTLAVAQKSKKQPTRTSPSALSLIGTTWKIYETINGKTEWGTYTFLQSGKILEVEDASWNLIGNKLHIKEQDGDIELVVTGNRMKGTGQLGMNPRPFPMIGEKTVEVGLSSSRDKDALDPSNLPETSDALPALWRYLADNVPTKGKFEKTGEYQKRINAIMKSAVFKEKKASDPWMYVGSPFSVEYDADAEIFHVTTRAGTVLTSITVVTASGFPPRLNEISLEDVEKGVVFDRAPNSSLEGGQGGFGLGRIQFKATPSDAQKLKPNLSVLYVFQVETPFFRRPVSFFDLYASIYCRITRIVLYDSETKTVYYDSDPRKQLPISVPGQSETVNFRVGPIQGKEKDDSPEEFLPPETVSHLVIDGGELNAKATSLPKPVFPTGVKLSKQETVTVQIIVSETGRVETSRAIDGPLALHKVSEKAALGARFSPTLISGSPVKVKGIIRYNFVN